MGDQKWVPGGRHYWTKSELAVWLSYVKKTLIWVAGAAVVGGILVGIVLLGEYVSYWWMILLFPYLVSLIATLSYWVDKPWRD